MRRSFAITGLLWAVLAPTLALAGGNALVPQNNADGSSPYSSLGLSSSPSAAPAAAPVIAPAPTTAPALSTPTPAAAPAAQDSMPTQASLAAASAAASKANGVAAPTIDSILSPVDQATAAQLRPGQIPTQVIQLPDATAAMAIYAKSLPKSITLAVDSRSVFSSVDVQEITDKLGIVRDQIPSACTLTLRGIMRSNKGGYLIEGPASSQVTVGYDGVITGYMMMATAMCKASRVPAGSGILNQQNGLYRLSLGMVSCPAPTTQAARLNVIYNNGTPAQCFYQ